MLSVSLIEEHIFNFYDQKGKPVPYLLLRSFSAWFELNLLIRISYKVGKNFFEKIRRPEIFNEVFSNVDASVKTRKDRVFLILLRLWRHQRFR